MASIQSRAQDISLIRTTRLSHYPSASTLEYHKGRLYVIGDDAYSMLVLDSNHRTVDSVVLFAGTEQRFSKKDKPDIESSIIVNRNNKDFLLAFGSYSSNRRRDVHWIQLDGKMKKKRSERLRLDHPDIEEWNIEGTALVNGRLLLTNRANNTHKVNHLLVTGFSEKGPDTDNLHSISIELPGNKGVLGISSISYLPEKDMLFFAASTENTANATEDGSIGDSYIGYINKISEKLERKTLKPDKLVNISSSLRQKNPQKIESLVVEGHSGKDMILHLAADNDNGESTLFKIKWRY
jgi:hypothetical protein